MEMIASTPAVFPRWRRPTIAVAFVLIVATIVWKAWLAEDSYIGFRMLDNLIHGYGLRWNVYERVNAITNPLWIFLNLPLYVVSGNVFFATFFTGSILVVATWVLLFRRMARDWDVVAGVILLPLLFSKTYTDFMVSGLETPLSVFLVAAFAVEYLYGTPGRSADARLTRLALIAALGGLSRPDLPVFFIPPLVAFVHQHRIPVRHLLRSGLLGGFPLLAWAAFCFVYYGFPLPNTYYMRLTTGIPARDYYKQGLLYVLDLVRRDPISAIIISLALGAGILVFTVLFRESAAISIAAAGLEGEIKLVIGWSAGIALLVVYVLRVGGDFMAGRFFLIPIFASSLLLGILASWFLNGASMHRRARVLMGVGAITFVVFVLPRPQLPFGYEETGIADEKIYYASTNDLRNLSWTNGPSKHIWSIRGMEARERANRSTGGIVAIASNIGMLGYYGGPRVGLIDGLGHTDAFLARLPVTGAWRIGHFQREIPEGYFESVRSGSVVAGFDPALEGFYRNLRFVTSGPVFSWDRIKAAVELNSGRYRPDIEAYRKRVIASRPAPTFVPPGSHPPPS